MKRNKTDLFDELPKSKIKNEQSFSYGITVKRSANKKQSIICAGALSLLGAKIEKNVKDILKNELENHFKIQKSKKILVVGLGNKTILNDSLGPKVAEKLVVSRGLNLKPALCAFEPNVFSNTGIETSELVKAVCYVVEPDLVVLVDSLSTNSLSRLCNCFQISQDGLVPGSGNGSKNSKISSSFLNVKKVLTIGVPMLIYAKNLKLENGEIGDYPLSQELILSPADVEKTVSLLADIISQAINECFFKTLTPSEIKALVR